MDARVVPWAAKRAPCESTMIRDWTSENFDFTGYITGFDPVETADRSALRTRLGYPLDAKLCFVTVGGSGVGTSLLHRVLDAIPLARRVVPGLEFVVVTGPRIDPATLPAVPGTTIHGYLPNLHHHLAAADMEARHAPRSCL